MMQFTRFFDLQDGVISEVVDENSSSSGQDVSLRVVGQEQNHELLLVWDDYLPFSSPKMVVTFIGSYHPSSKQFTKLFTFESTVNIVNCSLSPDRCVIAYTTCSTRDGEHYIYSAYLVEIHNRVRTCLYSLNLHHESLIKVQFLWPLKDLSDGDPFVKESRLLVLLHNKSVGLYTINLRRAGIGMVLHDLPVAEQVCGSFIWAQWDKLNQRLYLLVPRTKSGKTKNIFRCLEFTQGGAIPSTPSMEMELPFPIKNHHFQRNLYHYSLSHTVSDDCINMQVIAQSQGIFCVCYQHVSQHPRRIKKTVSSPSLRPRSDSTPTSSVFISSPSEHSLLMTSSTEIPPNEGNGSRNGVTVSLPTSPTESYAELKRLNGSFLDQNKEATHADISYSILCVHRSTVVSATIHQVPKEKTRGLKLFFGAQDGYIFVYSPGIVQHLVNVTPDFRSSHHIALYPADELYPSSDNDQTTSKLCYISCELTSRNGGTCMYDITHQTSFQYTWNKKLLCQCISPCLAKPLLHYAVIQARDSQMREEIMTHLTQDPTDPELVQIFLEFIVSSTYAAISKQVDDRDILAYFPFTTELTTEQLLQTREGERIATFKTNVCKHKVDISSNAGLKPRKSSYPAGNPYLFSRLNGHLERMKELDSKNDQRFSTLSEPLKVKIDQITETQKPFKNSTDVTKESPSPLPQTPNSTLKWATESVKKLTRSGKKKKKSRIPDVQQPAQTISSQTEDEWYFMEKRKVHIEALQTHLSQRLTFASSEKLSQIATTYCDCQIQQVHHLMNILIRSTGLDDKSAPSVWDTSLNVLASGGEQNLLLLMERVYVAMETHCLLVPKDFLTHFTCLGFRCLDLMSFLRYVKHGVFHLNKKFLLKVLKDLSDDERTNREKKKMILSILPSRELEMEMLRNWNHPEGNAVLTKIYLEKTWFSESAASKDYPPDQLIESPSANFPPVASLLRYTQQLGRTSLPPERDNRLSSDQIASAALFNTIQTCGADLQGFTF